MDLFRSRQRKLDTYNSKQGRLSRVTPSYRRKHLVRLAVAVFALGILLWRWRSSATSSPTSSATSSPLVNLRKPPSKADHEDKPRGQAQPKDPAPPLLLKYPSPAARHAWKAIHNAWPNPLNRSSTLQFDDKLVVESINPSEVIAGEEATVVFKCLHREGSDLCPEAYRVWFEGPTLHSPDYDSSSVVLDKRRIEVTFTLNDPGEYHMYAWPEHDNCGQWEGQEILYNKRVVRDAPRTIHVGGKAPIDKAGLCHSSTPRAEAGRWVSKAYLNPYHMIDKSPLYEWLLPQLEPTNSDEMSTIYNYVWTPYECKIPHKSIREWINVVRPSTMVIFGDSLLRDLFCLVIWRGLDAPERGPCDFYGEGYHKSNKQLSVKRADGGISMLHFVWLPEGDLKVLNSFLTSVSPTPSHILYGVALHLAKHNPETFAKMVKPSIQRLGELPQGTRTLVRTSGGVVQAIQCYDRIGGQRWQMEDINQVIKMLVEEVPGVKLFDVYPTLNDRPEATPDGRHWADIGRYWQERPEIGAAEFALLDAMFNAWGQQ